MARRIRHGNLHYLLELPRNYRRAVTAARRGSAYDVLHVNQGHCYLTARQAYRERWPEVFVLRSHGLDDHMGVVLRPWQRCLGLPRRSCPRTLLSRLLERALDRHIDQACRYVSGVIVSSGLDRDYLIDRHGMPPARVACIPQAPAAPFVSRPARPFSGERLHRLLFVGSDYWKGTHAAAGALNRLLSEDPTLTATWICPEASRVGAQALIDPSVLPRVAFPGWMAQEAVVDLFDEHGILLCPSLFEGFCKVFLEAMARGMCVVATPTGGMKDIIRDGENGLIVPFHDPDAIASAVRRLIGDPVFASGVAEAGLKTSAEFSWSRTASETAAFYEHLRSLGPRWARQ